MKKFFEEFKKFITRGNVLDMAVGVIVGGAFTAIVTAMTSNILQPLINALLALIFPGNGLEGAVTMLVPAYVVDEAGALTNVVDMANSIYINWGALISAIVNFLLVAFVLFLIVRIINRVNEAHEKMIDELDLDDKRAIKKICRQEKVKWAKAKEIYEARCLEEKAKKEEEARLAAEAAAEAARIEEEKATANTRLLEEIRDLLKASKQ
ncbi:MAG: large conductance mechanosensitive channel protein MscL [Clostridia bacterium]|nr:large conductance mechanosensitive channel protein MscL [Clostridia bacterium]